MSQHPFDPNSLPAQFRGNAADLTRTPGPPRSQTHLRYTEQVYKSALAAVHEAQLAIEKQRGHGPHRAEEVLMLAQLSVAEKSIEASKALVANQREMVFAEHEAKKAAARTTTRAANSNDRPSKLDVSKGETSASFARADAGVEQERPKREARDITRPVETSLDQKRGAARAAFQKSASVSERDATIASPPLNSQQVDNSRSEIVPRPSPSWAAGVDAELHRDGMKLDDGRAIDRNEYLKAIADGLAERRESRTGREQSKGPERDAGDGIDRSR